MRVRLVVAVLVLVGCALAIVGVVTVTALRHYLTGPVDAQLRVGANYLQQQLTARVDRVLPPPPPPGQMDVPSPYVLESFTPDGTLIDYLPKPLPTAHPLLTPGDLRHDEPFTTPSTNGNGPRWRVLVVNGPDGEQVTIASALSDVDRVADQLALIIVLVEVATLVAVTVLGVWLVRVSLRPLEEIERATAMISAGDLSRRAPQRDPRTEVGRLGQSFNGMIERIERAFAAQVESESAAHASEARARRSEDKMREFVADASHELRTPLTTIRGFAELYRQATAASEAAGAPGEVGPGEGGPGEVGPGEIEPRRIDDAKRAADAQRAAELVRRIEDEAARMGLLVEDLLLLARLDEQRPLAVEPVDLGVLVYDALESARATGPGRTIGMELGAGGPLVVSGDEPRLRQVLTNLLGNALKHTGPEASVTVRTSRRPGQAVIEVADTGPGLTPEQAQRVFERFYRADRSRNRHDGPPGTGLGLAIVAAIVAAHGGTVEVDSTPGEGTTFRVLLPLAAPEQPSAPDAPAA
ncbi:sensory box histidine kinase PhoR [Rugosimonospora acidiphila]|uniref:histidine kinase n=1 Tax=Rugosimonospora acidiphila TaxID=556531 RepID=A0ABP9RWG3_9ACTN